MVGHLKKGDNGRFAKIVFYFLRADPRNRCIASITGKRLNYGDGMGMRVPCTLIFHGHRQYIDVLQRELK